jgi:predicted DsbA family dithiol-disulfide isomerase
MSNAAPMHIEVVSDVICPWCFIGKRHLDLALRELAEEGLKFTVGWRPFQLNPDMPVGGIDRSTYRTAKFGSLQKSRELDAGVVSAGRMVGIDFDFSRVARTPNTLAAHRLIWLAGATGKQSALKEAVMRAYFLEGRDIGAPEVLAELAAEYGVDPAVLETDHGLDVVTSADQAMRQAGINGVPSFMMGGYLLFSGAVPADAMASKLRAAHSVLKARAA